MPILPVLQNPPVQPIPPPVAWGAVTTQSSFSNTATFFPIAPYATAPDSPGCYWDIPNAITLTPGSAYSIPPGRGWLASGASVNGAALQLQVGAIGTWVTIKTLSANDAFWYESDFGNVRILNGVSGTTSITLYPVRN
jgi:hypothetical protein